MRAWCVLGVCVCAWCVLVVCVCLVCAWSACACLVCACAQSANAHSYHWRWLGGGAQRPFALMNIVDSGLVAEGVYCGLRRACVCTKIIRSHTYRLQRLGGGGVCRVGIHKDHTHTFIHTVDSGLVAACGGRVGVCSGGGVLVPDPRGETCTKHQLAKNNNYKSF